MNENQFIVDIGSLQLNDEKWKKIDAAIHKAVAGELADMGTTNKLSYIPIRDLSKVEREELFGKDRGLVNGIVVRDL
jgi:hypothetical protein